MSDTMTMMLAMLAGELLLLLLVVLSIAWFRGRAARRRDERAIRLLVTRIRNSMAEREAAIGRFLDEHMGLSGEALAQAKNAIRRSELVLLQRFAEVYRRRDADAAARFDADLVSALTPYHELQAIAVADVSGAARVDDSELERLREQNQLLSEELSANMETMSKMVREFSTMFAESSVGTAAATSSAAEEAVAAPTGEATTVAESSTDEAMNAADRSDAGEVGRSDSAMESGSSDLAQPVDADLSTPEAVEALFTGGRPETTAHTGEQSEAEPPADEPANASVPAADAEVQEQSPPESAHTGLGDEEPETPVQIEAGDDLEAVAERLEEEGPAEVVRFDDPDEFDVEAAPPEDKTFDQEASDAVAAAQAQDGDLPDPGQEAEPADDNLDTDEEVPLKAQSRA